MRIDAIPLTYIKQRVRVLPLQQDDIVKLGTVKPSPTFILIEDICMYNSITYCRVQLLSPGPKQGSKLAVLEKGWVRLGDIDFWIGEWKNKSRKIFARGALVDDEAGDTKESEKRPAASDEEEGTTEGSASQPAKRPRIPPKKFLDSQN